MKDTMQDAGPRCFIFCLLLALSLAACDLASVSGTEQAERPTVSGASTLPPEAGKARTRSTKMSNTQQCDNLIDLGTLTKLVTVWYQDEVRRPPHGVVGCIEVRNVSQYRLKVRLLPEDHALRVTPVGPVTGTVTIDGDLITWTAPPNQGALDHWRVEVVDNSTAAPVVKHVLEMKLESA